MKKEKKEEKNKEKDKDNSEGKKKLSGSKVKQVVLILAGILLLLFGLLVVLNKRELKPCGYVFSNGFGMKCQCDGELLEKPDEGGKVSEGGMIQYCKGEADKELCFKDFGGGEHQRPYVCSDYRYTVDLVPVSSEGSQPFYPDASFAYEVEMNGQPMVLDTKMEVNCEKVKVMGFFEEINSTSFQGMRMYAEEFECVE